MSDIETQLAVADERLLNPSDRGLFWGLIILMLSLFAVAVGIFGNQNYTPIPIASSTPTPYESQAPRLYTVSYRAGVFSPTNLRIHAGDTVRFHNDALLPIRVVSGPHPQHNDYAGFDSISDIPANSYFSFTFGAKGTFGYHNENNINETGTIIVR